MGQRLPFTRGNRALGKGAIRDHTPPEVEGHGEKALLASRHRANSGSAGSRMPGFSSANLAEAGEV